MKHTFILLFICLLSTVKGQSSLESKDWSEKIQLYGHGFSVPTDFTDNEYEFIANTYNVFTVEKRHAYNSYGGNPSTERATIGTAAKLKAINPDIEVLLYWNAVMNYETLYEYNAEFGEHPEWVHSIWSTGYDIYDLTNIDCRNWWVNSIVEIIEDGDLDGVFLDAGPKADVSGLIPALNIAVDSVRSRIGNDKIVIYNGYRVSSSTSIEAGSELSDHTSGVFIEFFLHAPLDTKEEAALLFDKLTDAYNDGKMIFPRGTPSSFLPGTAVEDQFDFSFASFLLFYGPNTYWIYNEGYNKTEGMLDYHPDYYDKATGQSLGSPQRDGWVYTREFANVSIRVDLENKTSSITWIENPVDTREAIENLALAGTATQSTTSFDGDASLAIDGDTNGAFGAGSVTHTGSSTDPWWQVDLGASYFIGEITIFNRTDACCFDRFSDFTVYVLDEAGMVVDSTAFTTYPDPSVTMDAGAVEGRFVKVQIHGSGAVTLAEVQVAEAIIEVDKYAVDLKLVDALTGDSITEASIDINDLTYAINYIGEITLNLPGGEYPFTITKEGYYPVSQILSVSKDTAVVMTMNIIPQYNLNFKVVDGTTKDELPNVEITVDGEYSLTDNVGDVALLLDKELYTYSLYKAGYVSISDSLTLIKDTLVALQMYRENYTLTFQVNNADGDDELLGASVTINDSTYDTDTTGLLSLVLTFGTYDFVVSQDGYDAYSGLVSLIQDSVLAITISAPSEVYNPSASQVEIYPNQIQDILMINKVGTTSAKYQIFNIAGCVVQEDVLYQGDNSINLVGMLPGIYIVSVTQDEAVTCVKVLKQN